MTLMGTHTVAELEDLLKTRQYNVDQISRAYLDFKDQWIKTNPEEHNDWLTDWRAFVKRYEPAVRAAKAIIIAAGAAFTVPNNLIPAEGTYEGLLRALTVQTDGGYSKGDLQDLNNRLSAAQGHPIDNSRQPQPSLNSDFDHSIYKASDVTVKAFEKGGTEVAKSNYTWAILGGLGLLAYAVVKLETLPEKLMLSASHARHNDL